MSQGRCALCNGIFSKVTVTQHLKACREKNTSIPPSGSPKSNRIPVFHLMVEGRHLPEYWMHVEVSAATTLAGLDHFLRRTWLECCGHLSAFMIGKKAYLSEPSEDPDDKDMDIPVRAVLSSRMKFYYVYDFGTTTELTLRVREQRVGTVRAKPINLLARNDPPLISCGSCGRPAIHVCPQCVGSREGWLCDRCAADHECEVGMVLPIVNSPRVGMCAYAG